MGELLCGTRQMKEVKQLVRLTSWDLHYTKVTDADMKEWSDLERLTRLDLGGSNVTDACLKYLKRLQRLTSLDLGGTAASGSGYGDGTSASGGGETGRNEPGREAWYGRRSSNS